jgi:hypothetical protein
LIFMVQASFVTVEKGERGVSARQRFKGQGDSAAFVDVHPCLVDIFALLFHLDFQEAGLNGGVADEAPVCGGELPDEFRLGLVGGSEVVEVSLKLGFVLFFRLVGQNDGFGSKAVFYGIERDGAAALFRFWTAGFGSIDAGSFGSGRHIGTWRECSGWSWALRG